MNIMFSGYFDTEKNPQRIKFIESLWAEEKNSDVKFVIFNQAGVCNSTFKVLNIANQKKSNYSKSVLRSFLYNKIVSLTEGLNFWQRKRLLDKYIKEIADEQKNIMSSQNALNIFYRKITNFVQLLEEEKPDVVFLWNQFNAFHRFAGLIAENEGVKVAYFHDGVLPGSISLDFDGEMGNSWVSKEPDRFLKIPVTEDDLEQAEAFLEKIKYSKLNRHKQNAHIDFEKVLKDKGIDDRLLVLFCGQNDWHSGILPDSDMRKLHSPYFGSSRKLLEELDRLAEEHNFHILFKPHPNDKDRYCFLRADDYSNTTIISNGKIEDMMDYADVFVTIASQACYSAVIRSKPCILVGRNQMYGKGMSFDLKDPNRLASLIKKASSNHNTFLQKQALIRHFAQLNEKYLYSYSTVETDFYKRTPSDAMSDIRSFL